MKPRAHAWLGVAAVILAAAAGSYGQRYAPAKAPPVPQAESAKTAETGKALFLERCGSCHGERGDKALASGPPLSERKLTQEAILKAVRGRLKGKPEAEQRAVADYIFSFQPKRQP